MKCKYYFNGIISVRTCIARQKLAKEGNIDKNEQKIELINKHCLNCITGRIVKKYYWKRFDDDVEKLKKIQGIPFTKRYKLKVYKEKPMFRNKDAKEWGEYLFCITVVKSVSETGKVYVYGDEFTVDGGVLIINSIDQEDKLSSVAFSQAQWKSVCIVNTEKDLFQYPMSIYEWEDAFPISTTVEEEVQQAVQEIVSE